LQVESFKNGGSPIDHLSSPIGKQCGDLFRVGFAPLSPAFVGKLVLVPLWQVGLAQERRALARPTTETELPEPCGVAKMIQTKVESAATILAFGIYHPTDI
jgi:hypothetical protein